ncbi:MAG: hypothetical protein O8C66_14805 [Candidatus Methanoperedens sp.]|nr:hypothetical protein [Candidatus Methanoperedens sp.]MCZ7371771.1 hypothetical protein [Candidatus Methanoperedens sp.]
MKAPGVMPREGVSSGAQPLMYGSAIGVKSEWIVKDKLNQSTKLIV